ncbi:SGNH/GDSL hydrolase family protein [Neobacillus sp. NPDC097160]|uniref:SGNH/GDSL hydrolase family protein n=1 Tax=Neobacillus sp. NPDC097160 TaxID=3364298 RepID=UPI003810AEA4
MKHFFTIILGIACVAVLFFGHSYWNKRIEAASEKTSSFSNNKAATTQTIENEGTDEDIIAYTGNWPTTAVDRFKQTQNAKKPFKVLFVGSPAIGSDTAGSFPTVKEKLLKTFGKKNIQVDLKTYHSTSTQLVKSNKQDEIAAAEANLIVLEPFILMNNGEVLLENTLNDLTKIMDDIKAVNPETTFILQPSFPLYKARIYPTQVAELKKYAEQNQIDYLDHWSAWPDPGTEAIKDYLTSDQSAPSDKGYQVWSDYILQFLISK